MFFLNLDGLFGKVTALGDTKLTVAVLKGVLELVWVDKGDLIDSISC